MALNDTPRANRLHIAILGKRNSGKSSLINAITGQNLAIVSDVAGTTADPVYKAMELHGLGPVVFIDTAGFDDQGPLGELRVQKTREALDKADMALMVFASEDCRDEMLWLDLLRSKNVPALVVLNKIDLMEFPELALSALVSKTNMAATAVSAKYDKGIAELRSAIRDMLADAATPRSITGGLCKSGDVVMMVMPQDIQAPKGRLILPQVQTLRELLDKGCQTICTTLGGMDRALNALKEPPALMIVDSQTFKTVWPKKPQTTKLTSFSILFAGYKGDIHAFASGAAAIESLTENSRVLIAEACTHAPIEEDIGRVKIPKLLRDRVGQGLQIDFARGADFPLDLKPYDLIIHCGACMFNRKYVLNRLARAQDQAVPMTNYGVALAYLTGILDKVDLGSAR